MSSPIRPPRPRALRPSPESLEDRQLLSTAVKGIDLNGDRWVLKLDGPGDLRVTGIDGQPVSSTVPASIDQISVAGTDANTSRLVGRVIKAPNSDGRVFFRNLTEIGGRTLSGTGNNGLLAIDMPGFWLADTNPTVVPASGVSAASITVPDGVVTLRFGGVDTTAFGIGQNNRSDQFAVVLGLPQTTGTSIIVDRVISNDQPAASSTGTASHDSVAFEVNGRINLFQANAIEGTAVPVTTRFQGPLSFGTAVLSSADPAAAVTGAIGNFRVGGNATNLTVAVSNTPVSSQTQLATDGKLSNFYIGGETNQVVLDAPGGSRNVYFGKGMDAVAINSHVIETLKANRGANDSTVVSNRAIGRVDIGGDVAETAILSGYTVQRATTLGGSQTVTAQDGGGMTVQVAGSITHSVFAASVDALNGVYGTPQQDLLIPHGHITAKVEGTIDNSGIPEFVDPSAAGTAFFAKDVVLKHGPVTPPTVPEAPFRGGDRALREHYVKGLTGPNSLNHLANTTTTTSATTASTRSAARTAADVPRGPRSTRRG